MEEKITEKEQNETSLNEKNEIELQTTRELRLSSKRQVEWENVILTISLLVIYTVTLIYGIVQRINPQSTTEAQATLIILQCCGGLVLSIAPDLLEKFFKVKLSFFVRFGLELFGILGIVFGEGLQFYYRLTWWDDILHFSSGVGVAFLGFCIISNLMKNSSAKHKIAICIIGSICISFSIAFLWEIMEFSMDELFGANMQKSIPEIGGLFNGGSTRVPLEGTDEEIADFFRTPEGYRYALLDTMSDLVDCFIGTLIFQLVAFLITLKHKRAFENLIQFNYSSNKIISSTSI